MRRQTITIELTVPDDDGNDPDQILIEALADGFSAAGAGYSWAITGSSPVTETKRQVGAGAWHRIYIAVAGEPARTPVEMRAALRMVSGLPEEHGPIEKERESYEADSPAWATCIEEPDSEEGWWQIYLRPDHPLVEHVTTKVGEVEVEIPEL